MKMNESIDRIKMNLQLLAEQGDNIDPIVTATDTTDVQASNDEVTIKEPTKTEKTFTQDDIDRIISKKLAQFKQKEEARVKEIEEAEKLKRMSEAERQQAEMKKQLDEFNKMKSEMAREKLNSQVVKELSTLELPCEYAEYVMVEGDAEGTMARLKIFAEKYKADVQREADRQVQERLRGNAPRTSTVTSSNQAFTKEDIMKMSPDEINKNWDKIKHIKLT